MKENNIQRDFSKRFFMIDLMRATAIILMIFFHFSFDLNYFRFVNIDFTQNLFWYSLPRIIVFLFFTCVGMSLKLAHQDKIDWKKLSKKLRILFILSLCISLITFFIFPKKWVYFGTLHSIFCSILVSLPFLNRPKVSGIIGIGLFILFYFFPSDFLSLNRSSVDHISLYPWAGCLLLGIYLESLGFHLKLNFIYSKPSFAKCINFVEVLSKNSLMIYITHQIVLFGLLYFVYILVK